MDEMHWQQIDSDDEITDPIVHENPSADPINQFKNETEQAYEYSESEWNEVPSQIQGLSFFNHKIIVLLRWVGL